MLQRSFSARLRWAIVAPATVALLVALPILWSQMRSLLESTTAQNLGKSLAVLAPLVEPRLGDAPADLQTSIRELGGRSDLRLTVIRGDGVVVADSERTPDEVGAMDNHGGRPEVLQAFAEGRGQSVRRSATLGVDFVYTSRLLASTDDGLYVLRLAQPVSGLRSLVRRVGMSFAGALAAALMVVALISWRLHRTLFQPLADLVKDSGDLLSETSGRRVAVPEDAELASLARALNRLTERAESQLAALKAEEMHLSSILGSMSEGVLVTDANGQATLVNPRWRELFGIGGEIGGMSALELTRQTCLDRLIRETLATGTDREEKLVLPSVPPRTVLLTSSQLSTGGGAVVVAREITPFLRLAEMRRDFVANVSHELRTPLSAIRGFAETLQDGALGDRRTASRFLARILKQCERLELVLSDLLTLSRLEHPTPLAEKAPTDVGRLLSGAIEALERKATERQIELAVDIEPTPPLLANADALERMILNLLDNAIKYNRPGGRVRLRLWVRDEEIVLEVEDSGIGIPSESRDRLFERFYRVDKGRSRSEGGTGLGLAIVKHAAQVHDGRVEVESELGRGSLFRVRLPMRSPPLAPS